MKLDSRNSMCFLLRYPFSEELTLLILYVTYTEGTQTASCLKNTGTKFVLNQNQ